MLLEEFGVATDNVFLPTAVENARVDRSERGAAVGLLRESEERYRALFDRSSDWVYLHDVNGRFLDANQAALSACGYTKEEVTSTTIADLLHPDDVPRALARTARLLETGVPEKAAVYRVRRKDGDYAHLEVQTTAVCIPGRPAVIQGVGRDITDRVRQLEAVTVERRNLFSVLDCIPGLVYLQRHDYTIAFANQHFRQIFGDPGGRLCYEVIHGRTTPCDECLAMKVIATGEAGTVEGPTSFGQLYQFDIRPFDDDEGKRMALVMGVDITARRRAEHDRERLLAQLQAILGCLSTPLIAFHSKGLLWINQLALDSIGCLPASGDLSEMVPRLLARRPDGTPIEYQDLPTTRAMRLGRPISGERVIIKDGQGRDRTVMVTAVPLTLDGISGGGVVSWEDVTENELLHQRLDRAQRLEMAGRVAGQVAHDFNNLLSPLMALPELIKMQLPDNDRAALYCDEMMKATRLMADINADMLVLGRRGIARQEPIDLNERVRRALRNLQPVRSDVEIDLHLATDLMQASGSASQILRAITNLISNGLDSMPNGGRLRISTDDVYVDSYLDGHDRIPMGEYVRLEIEDTGCGIADEYRDLIFEPFFTTKRADRKRGSGLGLAIVQAVIEDHRGYIDLKSESQKGTTFGVYLPAQRPVEPTTEPCGLEMGNETVLVVDDDPLQRMVIEAMLTRLGYEVTLAASGEEALARLRQQPADLIILDMIMPSGIDGAETYRRALRIRPGQRAIVLSGFAESDRFAEAEKLGVGASLRKPISFESLSKAIRAVLSQ